MTRLPPPDPYGIRLVPLPDGERHVFCSSAASAWAVAHTPPGADPYAVRDAAPGNRQLPRDDRHID